MLEDLNARLSQYGRYPLLEGPTPIQRLSRLEAVLGDEAGGARLWVKRDDLMEVGGGGNKLRKLEFLIGEALAQGCDTFITTGGLQSNHARQSAAAAARAGMACELMLADVVPRHDQDYRNNGNLLLDQIFGARVHRLSPGAAPVAAAQARADELREQGHKVYVVGNGGSSPLGALGYAASAAEIIAWEATSQVRFDTIVVPNGSSGTHAGLVAGLAAADDAPERVLSYTVLAPLHTALSDTRRLAKDALHLLDPERQIADQAIIVDGSQRGEAYGIPTGAMLAAVRTLARSEGLLLDPVYSGKAFAGFLERARSDAWANRDVLYVMTGGTPGLFAYAQAFVGQ
ncbi:D-cysteine desulfhydrase family protein [Novosphingobium sp. 9U]|uniref:D-cysteine desulfhydrase family protein n=1 Tax=Novosphingobium sp. 9U TaxID=2653158 RepID=UPI0012F2922C|nr:D-cysteine desulfhydrase family protein [Novosphingobium sp. 9U]VWX52886.1 D-cysteine desulfhydrase family protein [Novosphingobium sp. 9U]